MYTNYTKLICSLHTILVNNRYSYLYVSIRFKILIMTFKINFKVYMFLALVSQKIKHADFDNSDDKHN